MLFIYQSMKSDDQESLDVDEAVDIDLPDVDMDPFSGIKPFLRRAGAKRTSSTPSRLSQRLM